MTIKTKFEFEQVVYLKTDPEQREYLVTGVLKRPGALLVYISHCGEEDLVYDFELSDEFDEVKAVGGRSLTNAS